MADVHRKLGSVPLQKFNVLPLAFNFSWNLESISISPAHGRQRKGGFRRLEGDRPWQIARR
jgi:hypothetical protein